MDGLHVSGAGVVPAGAALACLLARRVGAGSRIASTLGWIALCCASLAGLAGVSWADGPAPVDDARLAAADEEPHNWMAHGRTWSEQRYSPLDQIDAANVAKLGPAWVLPTGTHRGLEATPLVVDGLLVTTLTWSVVVAVDARTGREVWRYDPKVPKAWGRFACCDVVNRGVAWWEGRVYVGTLDGRLVALDARTGRVVFDVRTTDGKRPYTITGAPRVARGLVFIGNGGGEFGVRGYVSAYDARTGDLVWRFHTVPASKEGPHESPALALAAETWPATASFESGLGGTVWDSLAYDPSLDLLYVGVGNSSPYAQWVRSPGGGDNLYLASILALRAGTGERVWHYQTTPGERWDYTATQHMILAELEIGGRTRRVLMQAPKNGFFYVLDRETGELLSAEAYAPMNWASHVDPATGRPVETGVAEWDEKPVFVRPGIGGAHNWHPMSFSPRTGLVYIPTQDQPYPLHPDPDHVHRRGDVNTGEDMAALAASIDGFERALALCAPTHLTAWDPVAARPVWRVEHRSEVNGGVLSTAGGLVFKGSGDGRFAAFGDRDGRRLWEADLGAGVMAAPISYAIDGVQYVAVMAGAGGSAGLNFTFTETTNAGHLVAFKLGGAAPLPEVPDLPPAPAPVREAFSPEAAERGRGLYAQHCTRCHGANAVGRGILPDLRHADRSVHEAWRSIVIDGVRADRGMSSFADLLTPDDAEAIRAFVLSRALREPSLLERTATWLAESGVCVPPGWLAD